MSTINFDSGDQGYRYRQLSPRANIMLRLEAVGGEKESPEIYAEVIQPFDESRRHYLIHFTSVPPAVQ